MKQARRRPGCLRVVFRWTFRLGLVLLLFLLCLFVYVFHGALYNRFYEFPREAKAWEWIQADRVEPTLDDGWTEFRGACHSHSEISHDCEVTFPEILQAMKTADLNFICMSDHCVDDKADYSWGWSGLHDGVLFIRGFEMGYGFMPWGLPSDTILYKSTEAPVLAKQIVDRGGVLFIAHSEEPRPWDLPEISGMEIYNIHTDFKGESLEQLAPDIILSLGKYPDEVIRLVFDRQTEILKHWDQLNRTRMMVGISANDCHQNNGFRGYYTAADTLLLRGTGDEDPKGEWKLNFFTRSLLRLAFGPLEPDKQLFRVDIDAYQRSLRFVNNHVLAKALTEEDILGALKRGRSFIGFDMLADARGFVFYAETGGKKYVMGDTVPIRGDLTLRAASPNRVRFTLVRDGEVIDTQEGREYEYVPSLPGKYRLEAELSILDEWTPWVYTNPIMIAPSSGQVDTGDSASGA